MHLLSLRVQAPLLLPPLTTSQLCFPLSDLITHLVAPSSRLPGARLSQRDAISQHKQNSSAPTLLPPPAAHGVQFLHHRILLSHSVSNAPRCPHFLCSSCIPFLVCFIIGHRRDRHCPTTVLLSVSPLADLGPNTVNKAIGRMPHVKLTNASTAPHIRIPALLPKFFFSLLSSAHSSSRFTSLVLNTDQPGDQA